ncbi:MAG TPA: TIGR03067 domain-containing protein, partial [Gemmataceae bacterium]|nr:TIGR03067 domain-containing protein [Gemmataceae bacterium]
MTRYALPALLGTALLFTGTGLLTSADDAKDEAIKKERKQFEGTWQVVSLEIDGNTAAEEDAKKIVVINEPDGKWAIEAEGKVVARGTSTLDPTRKPKTIDLTMTEGDAKGQTALGIYEFGDDSRKV